MRKENIYIALSDYSSPNPTVEYGVNLAKKLRLGAKLVAIQGVPFSSLAVASSTGVLYPNPVSLSEFKKELKEKLAKLCIDARAIWPKTDFNVEIGFPEYQLLKFTEKENTFLLVIKGRNNLTSLNEWFGTYETRIAEGSGCPVLVLPTEPKWKPIQNILYVMDMNDMAVENMRMLSLITEKLQAKLTVAIISSEENSEEDTRLMQFIQTFRQLLQYKNIDFHQVFMDEAASSVERLIQLTESDIFAFEQKGKTLLERLFDDYNTKRLVLQSKIPVLVF